MKRYLIPRDTFDKLNLGNIAVNSIRADDTPHHLNHLVPASPEGALKMAHPAWSNE